MNEPITIAPSARATWILSTALVFGHLTGVEAQLNAATSNASASIISGPFSGLFAPLPPPEPSVRPFVADTYPEDSNGDRIEDGLVAEVARLQTIAGTAQIDGDRMQAESELADKVDVELIFNRQVTEEQINGFVAMGGEITYLYRSVSYGWNGRVARNRVSEIPQAMGNALVLVNAPLPAQLHLDKATQTGRVRPVWASGFAGSAAGYSGDTTITIAILDTGVDESHTDLTGRRVYWHDFSSDGNASPIDVLEHGSHVAGIALGNGAAGGELTGNLLYTQSGTLGTDLPDGYFYSAPIELPAASVNFNMTARWTGIGNGSTELYLVWRTNGFSGPWFPVGAPSSGRSPRTLNKALTGDPTRAYSPALLSAGSLSVQDFVVTSQVSSYPSIGDGFNKFRGVAPGCNWAGAKVFNNDGSGIMSYTDAALDDLVANRVARNIKVMNLSLGVIGDPGLSHSTRQKVNTAVNNGIVVVVSAGNDGGLSDVDDPGRAALALTVAAASDANQLTSYTSRGFTNPGSTAGQEEDFKPDLMAPGGSTSYQTDILAVDSNGADGPSFADQQANDYAGLQGTSMASPFAAGCAALVIDAMQQSGTSWDFNSSEHSRFVKMVLCATATESNANREGNDFHPTLQRAANGPDDFPSGKDRYEGYGMLNADAAVEAVSTVLSGLTSRTLGPGPTDRRAWATRVSLIAGEAFQADLTVPGTGDFDLYLYSSTPSAYGTPVRLTSSTQVGNGTDETISHTSSSNATGLLVVKRVSGSGTFDLVGPMVVGRFVFYNRSAWDGNDPASNANDDNAIAPDKTPLLPGGAASFANYTSYSRGLNGIMIDIAGLPGTPTVSDFTFKVGNDTDPSGWSDAPDPVSITVRAGAGVGGSDRITLIWNDNNLDGVLDLNEGVAKKWLQVTLKATTHTGLAAEDVFFFGNAVGECGNSPTAATVDTTDVLLPFYNQTAGGAAILTSAYDVNRDRSVDTTDVLLPFYHQTSSGTALLLLDLSGSVSSGGTSGSSVGSGDDYVPMSLSDLAHLFAIEMSGDGSGDGGANPSHSSRLTLQRSSVDQLMVRVEETQSLWQLQVCEDPGNAPWRDSEVAPRLTPEGPAWFIRIDPGAKSQFFRALATGSLNPTP